MIIGGPKMHFFLLSISSKYQCYYGYNKARETNDVNSIFFFKWRVAKETFASILEIKYHLSNPTTTRELMYDKECVCAIIPCYDINVNQWLQIHCVKHTVTTDKEKLMKLNVL